MIQPKLVNYAKFKSLKPKFSITFVMAIKRMTRILFYNTYFLYGNMHLQT